MRLQSDDFDQTIAFAGGPTGSNLVKGGTFGATSTAHIWIMTDPLSGTASLYKNITINTFQPTTGGNGGTVFIKVEGSGRTGSTTGSIVTRGVCYVRIVPGT